MAKTIFISKRTEPKKRIPLNANPSGNVPAGSGLGTTQTDDTFNLKEYIGEVAPAFVLPNIIELDGIKEATSNQGVIVDNVTLKNGVVLAENGTASAPSITFSSNSNTGVWRPFSNTLGFAAGGQDVVRLGTSGFKFTKTISTQTTDITTTVAAGNSYCGLITTQAANAVAGASNIFTVTNTAVTGNNDVVLINIVNYDGTTGNPVVQLDNIGFNTFNVVITNVHATDPLNGVLKLAFIVF